MADFHHLINDQTTTPANSPFQVLCDSLEPHLCSEDDDAAVRAALAALAAAGFRVSSKPDDDTRHEVEAFASVTDWGPSDDQIAAFKAAWHEADEEGDIGNRVRRGLWAVGFQRDVKLEITVSQLRAIARLTEMYKAVLAALQYAATEMLPGPDGQDYLNRDALMVVWLSEALEREDPPHHPSLDAALEMVGRGDDPSLCYWCGWTVNENNECLNEACGSGHDPVFGDGKGEV